MAKRKSLCRFHDLAVARPHTAGSRVCAGIVLRCPARGVVNGVLRAAAREREELLTRGNALPLFIRRSRPQFLVARWQQHFGEKNTEELCKWDNLPPPIYGRINRLKIDPKIFLQLYPDSRALPGDPDFVEFDELASQNSRCRSLLCSRSEHRDRLSASGSKTWRKNPRRMRSAGR
jgi:16S rRNA methyltransferase RsmF-like protein